MPMSFIQFTYGCKAIRGFNLYVQFSARVGPAYLRDTRLLLPVEGGLFLEVKRTPHLIFPDRTLRSLQCDDASRGYCNVGHFHYYYERRRRIHVRPRCKTTPDPRSEGAYTALRKLDHRGGLYRDPGEYTIPPPTTLVSAHGISHQKSNGFCIPVGHWPGSVPTTVHQKRDMGAGAWFAHRH